MTEFHLSTARADSFRLQIEQNQAGNGLIWHADWLTLLVMA
jgi:hypothetical protein